MMTKFILIHRTNDFYVFLEVDFFNSRFFKHYCNLYFKNFKQEDEDFEISVFI